VQERAVQCASRASQFKYERRQPERTALYAAVAENLPTFLERADGIGRGLPGHIRKQLGAYLRCCILAHGFVRVRCEGCKSETLVGFSCKGRGSCPSCDAKRAALAAAHLTDTVLPQVAYRQWTLSFPFSLRFRLANSPSLLSRALRIFIRALCSHQRAVARRLGVKGRVHTGAVAFSQRFGSALQLTPHFHVLVPEGVWLRRRDGQAETLTCSVAPAVVNAFVIACVDKPSAVRAILEHLGLPSSAPSLRRAKEPPEQLEWLQ
jgi:hypothetical protein